MENIKIGDVAPDFRLPASNGFHVSLSDFRGKKVVLYFYPKDMTPGCTTEACDFRDYFTRFAEINTVVLGVSTDSIEKHLKFIDRYELPFLLLSDEDHAVAELYGVWGRKKRFGREYDGIIRSTFLIDEEGKIIHKWNDVKVVGHAAEVYSTILLANRTNAE